MRTLITQTFSFFALSALVSANTSDPTLELPTPTSGFTWSSASGAQPEGGPNHAPHGADSHAPAGVMGDHTHKAGEWMLSLRYMHMSMDGNRDGTNKLSPQEVFSRGYMVAPISMSMDMLMLGAMYAPTDDWTFMAMIPYASKSMDHQTMMGGRFTTETSGLADVQLGGLWRVYEEDVHHVHLNLGLSVPTGSIDERDDTPVMTNAVLPYPMQLGSGTWDIVPGATYRGANDRWSWGAQGLARVRLGENDQDYALGDRYDLTGWVAKPWSSNFSTSARLAYANWGNISGADSRLNPGMVQTADPSKQGGERIDLGLGLNWKLAPASGPKHYILLEVLAPIHQDLDGPQLETDWRTALAWQLSF